MEYKFTLGAPEDADGIIELIEKRTAWMDREGIRQWNMTGYKEVYPADYYREEAAAGRLYVLKRGGTLAGALVLLEEDQRWEDERAGEALYVHNFVTALSEPGAGGWMLEQAENLARERGKRLMRLDCAIHNLRLNEYYEKKGYRLCGTCTDGPYVGNKREKTL